MAIDRDAFYASAAPSTVNPRYSDMDHAHQNMATTEVMAVTR